MQPTAPNLDSKSLDFLKGIYQGKDKLNRKQMSNKIFARFKQTKDSISKQLKTNVLLKAFIDSAHNKSIGVRMAHDAGETEDLGNYLHKWYKKKYQGDNKKKGISDVEKAIKYDEEESARPPGQAKKKKGKNATKQRQAKRTKGKGSPGKAKGAQKRAKGKAKGKGKDGVKSYSSIEETGETQENEDKDDDSEEENGSENELQEAAESIGVTVFSKEELIKDLDAEEKKEQGIIETTTATEEMTTEETATGTTPGE